jgi:energy-coupling factor transport system substrate-specific component
MREVLTMWRDTRMIMLVAVVAAVYAAVLIPFKALTLIPGITSIRPANVFPVIFSLMFGPAAAWGAAIGNLIGDLVGGTFGPGSVGGFVGNFFFGFVGYKLWGNLGPLSSGELPDMREKFGKQMIEYVVIAVTASTACAAIIAWWLEAIGLFPFSVLGTIITINNTLAAVVLGPPLLYLTYPRIEDMGLLYTDVMREEDLATGSTSQSQMAAWGLVSVSILWVVVGIAISVGVQGIQFGAAPGVDVAPGTGGSTTQTALGAVGLILLVVLSWMGRERLSAIRARTPVA